MDWFLYDRDLRYERVKKPNPNLTYFMPLVSFLYLFEKINFHGGGIQKETSDIKWAIVIVHYKSKSWLKNSCSKFVEMLSLAHRHIHDAAFCKNK